MSEPLDQLKQTPSPAENSAGAPAGTPPPAPIGVEDAGAHALSEALRSSFAIVKVIMIILVLVFFASGVFTVPSQQKAIVLRFGRPIGTGEKQLLEPGLHWSFPYPIDEIVRIPIKEIQTVTSTAGWYATTPEMEATNSEPDPGPSLNPAIDGYTLTGDGNIIHVRAALRYRINNPLNYSLNFVNASNVVQDALDNALFHASVQFTVDEALRLAVIELKEKILARVRQLVDEQALGITIEDAELRTLPPRQLKTAFANVIGADLERRKAVSEAQGYANRILSTALGEANSVVNAGRTEGTRLVQSVAADAKYFLDQLPHYQSNPQLFMARLQTETLQRILTNSAEKVLRGDSGQRQMWLQLSREPLKPSSQPSAQP